jgi:putative ABC transport system substrate-binding protein
MKRREFISLLGGAAATWPLAARAQRPSLPVVGILFGIAANAPITQNAIAALRQGLNGAGFTEGENVTIEYRWAENQYDRLPALATDLANRRVAVIVAIGAPAAAAAKSATTQVPIVFYMGEDPVNLGLVPSLNHPGGNVTGVAYLSSAVLEKRLELLHELVPQATVIATLINPKNPNAEISTKDAQKAASALGLQIHTVSAGSEVELETAFAALKPLQARALLIAPDGFFNAQADLLTRLAARHAMPASHEIGAFARLGGLISYGGSITEGQRQTGAYAGQILKGAKPADLPILQPTKFELVINLKTAKALGLDVPLQLQQRADEVVE